MSEPNLEHLSEIQRELLLTIIRFSNEHQRFPTIRELRTLMGLTSTSGPMHHIRALVRHGALERVDQRNGGRSAAYRVAGSELVSYYNWPKWVERLLWIVTEEDE